MPLTQWSTPDGCSFFPAGEVVKNLPPGYYSIEQSMRGVFYKQKNLKNETLIKLPDLGSTKVTEEISKFWLLENKFRDGGVPYKRGIILYGPPGSGKTCTLRMVVDNLVKEQGGIVVDYAHVEVLKEAYEVLRSIHQKIPLIILMEDIDAILDRSYTSDVLNLLDGMYGIDKVVFVATTNYPEKLGSRIMNRPSRFDRRIFIGMPTEAARREYLKHKVKDITEEELKLWVKDTAGLSIAHLKELYVATRILGEDYNDAITAIKGLREAPSSSSFDDYGKTEQPKSLYTVKCESEEKPFITITDDKYADYGTGNVYKKIVGKKNISEREGVRDIAKCLNEDIRRNNGFSI